MAAAQSAQEFVRALRAPTDPPHPNGPFKIEVARQTWENTTLYIPNKAEVITDWLLTRLLKDKAKERASNPLFDLRYWSLLSDILSADTPKGNVNLRVTKPWLVSLVNRVPIAPIVISYCSMLSPADALHTLASRCLLILWPLAISKCNPETLLECFGALLLRFSSSGAVAAGQDVTPLASAIVSSYRTALSNSTNKKKLYMTFLHHHFLHWLECLCLPTPDHESQQAIASDIYASGIETLFSLDVLRLAGDQNCDPAMREVLITLVPATPDVVFETLPRLFTSFVQSLKRHRSALFGQGSNQASSDTATQVQAAGMTFFTLCIDLLDMVADNDTWNTRIALLEMVHRENLFNVQDHHSIWSSGETENSLCKLLVLPGKVLFTNETISQHDLNFHNDRPAYSMVQHRSGYLIPSCDSSILTYLGLLLDYHSTIRAIQSFVLHWFDALSVQHLQAVSEQPRDAYSSASSGPLLSFPFLDRLSKAMHSFLTPGQVLDIVQAILQRWKDAFISFKEQARSVAADHGEGTRKKRKIVASLASGKHSDPEWAAVTFSLLSKAVVVVLVSLPVHSVLEDVRQEIRLAIREAYSLIVPRALKNTFKVMGSDNRTETWHWQVVACAALRAHYGLVTVPRLSLDLRLDDQYISKMLLAAISEETLPEFAVEMLRNVLLQSANEEANYSNYAGNDDAGWNGKPHHLANDTRRDEGTVAFFHLLLDRWLPLLNEHASTEQLKRLAKVITSVKPHPLTSSSTHARRLTTPVIVAATLRNAQFWELHHMRDVFLAELQEQTVTLESVDLHQSLSQLKHGSARPSIKDIPAISATYEILLYTPEEYLPRTLRAKFLRRALAADVSMGVLLDSDSVLQKDTCRSLAMARWNIRAIFKSASKGDDEAGIRVIQSFIDSFASSEQVGRRELHDDFRQQGLLRLIDTVTTHKLADSSEQLRLGLAELHVDIISQCLPQLQSLISENGPTVSILDGSSILQIWAAALSLGRWLQSDGEKDKQYKICIPDLCSAEPRTLNFGSQLVGKLLSEPLEMKQSVEACMAVLAILLEELQASSATSRHTHMEGVITSYIAFSRLCGSAGIMALDHRLSSTFKMLEVVDFAYMLDFSLEALATPGPLSTDDIASLVHLSNVMMHDAPEGSLKVIQNHVTRCLSIFANHHEYLVSPSLRRETLDFVSRHFNDHPASIKAMDLSSVWSILGHLVAGSMVHDKATDRPVFHQIIAIISALIRLRRDLVLCTLPHLGMVLRQLTMSLRSLRPQLGGKQSKLVLSTLPRWMGPSEPLTAEESKALARLLTTLTTKTIVRTFASPTEAQKAESLVRPFSKHAAAVITAYIEALNDPLCFLSTQVRRDLQPGLFALCEMLGEQTRDSLMVSTLDAGGKATMKALWKEYEKQKYIGKG
ncbi:Urb2/Npa2 family-domain-containing protein [Amylocystis lapponica]|nr:Urb2/Npa2 family-domain-containing protein [Amylocystis lapponica]